MAGMKWEDAYRVWTATHEPSVTRAMRQNMAYVKTFERGWDMRQPEIDALNAKVEHLQSDREKVVRQAQQNDKLLFENARLAGKLMQYEEPERYAEYCRVLEGKSPV